MVQVEVIQTKKVTFANLPIVKMVRSKSMLVESDEDIKILNSAYGFARLNFDGNIFKIHYPINSTDDKDIAWLERNQAFLEPIDKGGMPMFAFDRYGKFIYGIAIFKGSDSLINCISEYSFTNCIPEEKEKHCFVKFISNPNFSTNPWDFQSP